MPVRFACPTCQQRLSVTSRKIGTQVNCPKCQRPLTVPATDDGVAAVKTPSVAVAKAEKPTKPSVALSDPLGFDDVAAVLGTAPAIVQPRFERSADNPMVDRRFVAISRRVLYLQGGLMLLLAAATFVLGYLVGRGGAPAAVDPKSLEPVAVQGLIQYQSDGGQMLPDQQAVAILFPQGIRPPQKIDIAGLRPEDPPAAENNNLRAVESCEGLFARADDQGRFEIRARPGVYQVLVISRHAQRPPGSEPKSKDLLMLGGYFQPAPDLLGPHRYEYAERHVAADAPLEYKFGR